MNIALDGIVLRNLVAGSHRYFAQLLAGLAQFGNENTYTVFANLPMLATELPTQTNWASRHVNTMRWLPDALRQQCFFDWRAPDVLHSIGFVPPLWYNRPCVVTVFDLAFLRLPHTTTRMARLWWRTIGVRGIRRASHVIAISENTRRDLIELLQVPAHQVSVVYPATAPAFSPAHNEALIAARYNLPARYILFVGTLEPRKNIVTLLRAFALARRDARLDHQLILVGRRGWRYKNIFRTVTDLNLEAQVKFLEQVPDEHLATLYARADLFAYLSLYEGFGFPVLEAMACGVPVLASNTSALPEVVGDAGALVDPRAVNTIAQTIVDLLADPAQRATMRERGLQRARLFSLEKLARQTGAIYTRASQL